MSDVLESGPVADQEQGETFKFVVTIEGDTIDKGTLRVEALVLNADGTVKETGPDKTKAGENILVSLYDAGVFLQSMSLTMGFALAAVAGDKETALGILKMARALEIPIGPKQRGEAG